MDHLYLLGFFVFFGLSVGIFPLTAHYRKDQTEILLAYITSLLCGVGAGYYLLKLLGA